MDATQIKIIIFEDRIPTYWPKRPFTQNPLQALLSLCIDDKIYEDVYSKKQNEIKVNNQQIQDNIEAFHNINPIKLENGACLLELAQNSVIIYKNQEALEKRKLVKIVHSNLQWRDNKLNK